MHLPQALRTTVHTGQCRHIGAKRDGCLQTDTLGPDLHLPQALPQGTTVMGQCNVYAPPVCL